MRRLLIAALSAEALTAAIAPVLIAPPAVNTACLPGETGVIYGCAPFCLPGSTGHPDRFVHAGAGSATAAPEWLCAAICLDVAPCQRRAEPVSGPPFEA